MTHLLDAENLVIDYVLADRRVRALDGASLTLADGETLALVGESGSGKSTLGSAAGRLLPSSAEHRSGDISVAGESLFGLSPARIRQVRRERLGFVFQDPIGALDPTMRIGRQVLLAQGRRADRATIARHLERVRLRDPDRIMRAFPHQLSGGMAQRVAIAMAMAARPRLLVADEPTAALDSQVRQDVLDTVFALAAEAGTGILLLTHDLSSVSRRCGRMAVMYGGRVVEDGPAADVMNAPRHPYTAALARSVPGNAPRGARLEAIPGRPPVLSAGSAGCAFEARCGFAIERCRTERPEATRVDGRTVLCHRAAELARDRALSQRGVTT
ncbi:ABC transporter ATP-binding protein [Streptosporangium oxazolinicum]|uniref:ABC transporter ATP-binding protein n=1 Tax=Streptosporangium oxazolinicum TaxID=909287 RepID=A0ABP8B7G4_9ACTN